MQNADSKKYIGTDPVYTLSIASKLSEVPAHSIRQYIDKGLILPFNTETNRHLFSDIDIVRLRKIKEYIKGSGLNIAGIKAIFSLIPCWVIKPCTQKQRINCGAYNTSSQPCWEASNKSEICLNSDCRECDIYKIPETCDDLKSMLKEVLNNT